MKIVYQPNIADKIARAIDSARKASEHGAPPIERIELTPLEFVEFENATGRFLVYWGVGKPPRRMIFMGVPIVEAKRSSWLTTESSSGSAVPSLC